jgi:hypothetical protein
VDPRVAQLLGECLERLDACDRALIELRYYQDLPFKEIARRLGRTPAALRVRLTRACHRLRRYLKSKLAKRLRYESSQAAASDPRYPSTSDVVARFDASIGKPCRYPDAAVQVS